VQEPSRTKGPLEPWGGGWLGTLDADRAPIEIIVYRAASVFATITTDDGAPVPDDASFLANYSIRGGGYGGNTVRQDDVRHRAMGLMPDQEYNFYGSATGYVPKRMLHLSLPEGGTAELALVIRKKPIPPAVGDLAPTFNVTTLDGQDCGLGDFRGRFLLLHLWSPYHKRERDIPRLDAIGKRLGSDRLALFGLCLTNEPDAARKVIEDQGLTWPQAVLRDDGADPIVQDLGGPYAPTSLLIGPEGKIVARDLSGDTIEEAVAAALGGA
jgi:AhpC/TSA family